MKFLAAVAAVALALTLPAAAAAAPAKPAAKAQRVVLPTHVRPDRYDIRITPDAANLSFTGHVANVVRPQIVRVQQLVGQSTVPGLLRCLDDREGIVGEENLSELLPHSRPIDNETRGKRAESCPLPP